MKPGSMKQLHRSRTLEGIGGVSTLRKFKHKMPTRARAFLLAKICSELGKTESAKKLARISAREYVFYEREPVSGNNAPINMASYALAKCAAEVGRLEKKEFEAIVQEGADKHIEAGSLEYAMRLLVDEGLVVSAIRLADRVSQVMRMRMDYEFADRIEEIYVRRVPNKQNVEMKTMRFVNDLRREEERRRNQR
ncbi:hypothetical protein JW721_01630 [Candidatus Micrarchaeota archaeon]|nr:hypothetical protein [Candidatus Micrarchaeota archaeon]